MDSGNKKIIIAALLLIIIISVGIFGYIMIESFGLIDAIYMTMITLTTVGFGEVHPLSQSGKIFTAALSFISLGFFAYSISLITTHFVEGQFSFFCAEIKLKNLRKWRIM
jgi:voltage-gated potassium channel